MHVAGSYSFAAPRGAVWDLLMDVPTLASCIPGCEGLEPAGEHRYRAAVTVSLAAISDTFHGTVSLSDMQPPTSYRLAIEARGRTGFVSGGSAVTLAEQGDRTLVSVQADVQVGGAVARVGQRLLGTVSKMMLDRFFDCLAAKVG
jgi:carbon monoxide dehydrogenase subunit G